MKILLVLLLFVSNFCFGQVNKAYQSDPYIILWDSTVKKMFISDISGDIGSLYTLTRSSDTSLIVKIYGGKLFYFLDTLVASDFSQILTTGLFKITLHNNLTSTTKRNILVSPSTLLQFDNSTQELSSTGEHYPFYIKNRSTGATIATLEQGGGIVWHILPSVYQLMGSIKKITVP